MRLDWTEEVLTFDVRVVSSEGEEIPDDVEYLYWVGCAGAIEDRSQEGHPGVRGAAAHRRA